MTILIKHFGTYTNKPEATIEERNLFAKSHKVIADQTHWERAEDNVPFFTIESFYEDGYNPIEALKQEIRELKALLQEKKA